MNKRPVPWAPTYNVENNALQSVGYVDPRGMTLESLLILPRVVH